MCRLSVPGSRLRNFLWVASILLLCFDECLSLNDEGLALLEFRSKVDVDPHGVFRNWDPEDQDPCSWVGVHCIVGKVEILNLKELSLGGTLAPELGKLSHLRSLVLYKNHFYGDLPKEIGQLTMLELLDVRGNCLSDSIPIEITEMISLGRLLLCDDKFQSSNPLIELKCEQDHSSSMVMDIECTNRKFKYCIQQNPLQQLEKANSFVIPSKDKILHFLGMLPWLKVKRVFLSHGHGEEHGVNIPNSQPYIEQNMQLALSSARRKLLQESLNLPAVPVSGSPPIEAVSVPSFGSGAFPAVPNSNNGQSSPISPKDPTLGSPSAAINDSDYSSETTAEDNENSVGLAEIIVLVLPGAAIVLILIAGSVMCLHQKGPATVAPAKTGLSGPLQKAFVDGVTKLNKAELEAACEDFSNIISTFPFCTVYKGTLSSGVEIAVVSTSVTSADWSKRSEAHFRKKVDTLSRINHKNFVNLLGYCEENEPFMRMVVLEYAPTGTLYEHLHEKEYEHLDWSLRMRIIMGTAYCLQYLEELNPPVVLGDLQSRNIYLTDDYAAKVFDRNMWEEISERRNKSGEEDKDPSESSSLDPGSNFYNFGIIMLETISGRVHSQGGSILHWATDYLNDKSNFKNLVDPTLKSFKNEELEVVCEAIQECLHGDLKDKSKIKLIVGKLREGLGISPEAACPRLSPLWWAELEILSVEAS